MACLEKGDGADEQGTGRKQAQEPLEGRNEFFGA
jgi:hypothetical protein